MPSAEDTTYLIEVMPEPGANRRQDGFTSRDVDVLVSRIKENLRLSGLKSRSSLAQKMRSTPYALPSSRAWADPAGAAAVACKLCAMRRRGDRSAPPESEGLLHQRKLLQQQQQRGRCRHCRSKQASSRVRAADLDSYERFQALLRNGALIKEAVKRLQTCPEDNNEDEEGAGKRRASSTSATSTTLDSMDDDEEEEDEDEVLLTGRDGGEDVVGGDGDEDDHFFYRRKRFYYNSEEEPLPPVYQPLDL